MLTSDKQIFFMNINYLQIRKRIACLLLSLSIFFSGLSFANISPNVARADIPIVSTISDPVVSVEEFLFDWSFINYSYYPELIGWTLAVISSFSYLGAF